MELQQGADTLADGSRRLADGVQLLVDQTRQLGTGLGHGFGVSPRNERQRVDTIDVGFLHSCAVLNRDDIKKAAGTFVSPDGHSVRFAVQTELPPFSVDAMNQVD